MLCAAKCDPVADFVAVRGEYGNGAHLILEVICCH